MYILHYIVTSQENSYQLWIFPSYLKGHSLIMMRFFLESNLTTSLQQRSFLLLIGPNFLVTGDRPTEMSFFYWQGCLLNAWHRAHGIQSPWSQHNSHHKTSIECTFNSVLEDFFLKLTTLKSPLVKRFCKVRDIAGWISKRWGFVVLRFECLTCL